MSTLDLSLFMNGVGRGAARPADSALRMVLVEGEALRLPLSRMRVRVLSGTAWITQRQGSLPAPVTTAPPTGTGAFARDSRWISSPPLRTIAPATPPPCASAVLAAFTIASVASSVRSPTTTAIWPRPTGLVARTFEIPASACTAD